MTWTKKDTLIALPSDFDKGLKAAVQATGALGQILQTFKSAADVIANITITELDLSQMAVKAAITAAESSMEALNSELGAYLLFVPARQKSELPALITEALKKLGLNDIPAPSATVHVPSEWSSGFTASELQFFQQLPNAQGGNQGFIRTVYESLTDRGDPNRPQFSKGDYVTGFYMVMGGFSGYNDVLRAGEAIMALFGKKLPASHVFDFPVRNTISHLRGKVVARRANYSVLLEWDPLKPVMFIANDSLALRPVRYAVLRSKSVKALAVKSGLELVSPDDDLKLGPTSIPEVEVIAVQDVEVYDTFTPDNRFSFQTTYYDDTELELGKPYYYAVLYEFVTGRTALEAMEGDTTNNPVRRVLSNFVKVQYDKKAAKSARSTPPDWSRVPRLGDLVPVLGDLIAEASAHLEAIGQGLGGATSLLKGYVQWLKDEIDAYAQLAINVNAQLNRILRLVRLPSPLGIYWRTFGGQGGNQFLLSDLTSALTSDTNHPPFSKGDELVMGVVFVAGTPSLSQFNNVKTIVNQIGALGKREATVFEQAQVTIERQITQLEDAFRTAFDDRMKPSVTAPVYGVKTNPPLTATAPSVSAPGHTPLDPPPAVPPGTVQSAYAWPPVGADDEPRRCPVVPRITLPEDAIFGPDMRIIARA